MRKLITVLLALIIALTPMLASAEESINLAALLADKSNQNLGNETGVYNALYKILVKANGKDFPLRDIMLASTCMSKIATGEDFSPEETRFDESLSAYEKFFLITLTNATLSDEEAEELTAIFDGNVKAFPAKGKELYIAEKDKLLPAEGEEAEPARKSDKEAFITGLMRQAMEKLGYKYEPETINEALTLYAVKDQEDAVILSAHDILTSLPHAILMKHVPDEKKLDSAAALARIEATIPDITDWAKIIKGDDVEVSYDDLDDLDSFLEDDEESEEEEDEDDEDDEEAKEEKVELTEEQIAEWTEKWLKLVLACDAYDLDPTEDNFKAVSESLLAMTDEKPEITFEEDGGISLKFNEEAAPAATAVPSKSSGSSSGTKKLKKELITLEPPYTAYTGKYIVYVSKNTRTIAILGRDSDNRWTKLVKKFPTSIGKAGQTRSGLFWVSKKERWHSWSASSYSPYSVKQSGGSYIHGPMYKAKDSNKMDASSYNAIGTATSAGCLGTVCAAAGFIYYNCPIGTMVIIKDDGLFKASKPKKIPDDQTYDPTEKSIVKKGDPDASIAASPTANPDSSDSGSSNGGDSSANSGTTPTSGDNTTTGPSSAEILVIKELQSLLFMYDRNIDLSTDVQAPSIGDQTKAALKAFQLAYNAAYPEKTPLSGDGENNEASMAALREMYGGTVNQVRTALGLAEGSFDQELVDKVSEYQKAHEADGLIAIGGITDKATLDLLAVTQVVLGPEATPTPTPTPTPTQTPTPTPEPTSFSFSVSPTKLVMEANGDPFSAWNISVEPTDAVLEYTYTYDGDIVGPYSETAEPTQGNSGSAENEANSENTSSAISPLPFTAETAIQAKKKGTGKIKVTGKLKGVADSKTQDVEITVNVAFPLEYDTSKEDAYVKEVQRLLVLRDKFNTVTDKTDDGKYGDDTAEAIGKYLENNGLINTFSKENYDKLKSDTEETLKSIQGALMTLKNKEGLDGLDLSEYDSSTEKNPNDDSTPYYGNSTKSAVAAFQTYYNSVKNAETESNSESTSEQNADAINNAKLNVTGLADEATRNALSEMVRTGNQQDDSSVELVAQTPIENPAGALIEAPAAAIIPAAPALDAPTQNAPEQPAEKPAEPAKDDSGAETSDQPTTETPAPEQSEPVPAPESENKPDPEPVPEPESKPAESEPEAPASDTSASEPEPVKQTEETQAEPTEAAPAQEQSAEPAPAEEPPAEEAAPAPAEAAEPESNPVEEVHEEPASVEEPAMEAAPAEAAPAE